MAMYGQLNPEAEGYCLKNLIFDLMHHCDREPDLGSFDGEYGRALGMYERFVAESEWTVGPNAVSPPVRSR